jgi:hypothetical protein
MRRILMALALCALPLSAVAQRPPRTPGGVHAEYDRFKRQTFVYSDIVESSGSKFAVRLTYPLRVRAFTAFNGVTIQPAPQSVYIRVGILPSLQEGWQILNGDRTVYLVLPDGRTASYTGEYSNSIETSNLYEAVIFPIAVDDLMQLAQANKVEGRLGNREFKMEDDEIKKLRNFLEYVTGHPFPKS